MAELVHASAAARRIRGGWAAVLMGGPSGAGKSDLALRLVGRGWRLVGDDYCHVWASGGALHVRGDPRIQGRMEIRGLGVAHQPFLALARAALWIECVDEAPDRMPDPARRVIDGLTLPAVALRAWEASAPDKVEAALLALGGGGTLA